MSDYPSLKELPWPQVAADDKLNPSSSYWKTADGKWSGRKIRTDDDPRNPTDKKPLTSKECATAPTVSLPFLCVQRSLLLSVRAEQRRRRYLKKYGSSEMKRASALLPLTTGCESACSRLIFDVPSHVRC